jgi:multimeric flavodoxin WrbA
LNLLATVSPLKVVVTSIKASSMMDIFIWMYQYSLPVVSLSDSKRTKRTKIKALGVSTSPRIKLAGESNSKMVLKKVLGQLQRMGAETQLIDLKELKVFPCGGHYSLGPKECHYPCRRMEEEPSDQLLRVYEAIFRSDIIIFATPIRWGNYSSLMQLLIERMNCVENMDSVFGVKMIKDKVAGLVLIGHEDGYQRSAGTLMSTLSFMGFHLPANSICYFVGLSDELTDRDLKRMKENEALKNSIKELAENTYKMVLMFKRK